MGVRRDLKAIALHQIWCVAPKGEAQCKNVLVGGRNFSGGLTATGTNFSLAGAMRLVEVATGAALLAALGHEPDRARGG